ncbi:MFS transporter [Halieaceae bacterium IMCC14734]|uniref:MFS transporter n=1 Tax=Candidatus Litorirhabdus singularis TaxID=2518993 RepID=A0ABT3TKW5_9GAMM|nr:MFS transporter [Candidatus Litorirhabdus singularis]MCX2982911.1 MFS transporter [Candidatus Litorirhabdus singularis]
MGAATPLINTGQAYGTSGYRNFVLISLTLVYTLNFIDRVLIGVVAQPIIEEFKLQDWQFGLLSGFGFALMYTVMGIPIARWAERYNRVRIIAGSVILWSLMTALCGIAGSFVALLVFRIGVGIGEAGCTPPANSIIADYFPARSRARALAIYALGVTLGGVLANAFGGPIAQMFSWREAFLALGIPGIVIGFIVLFSVKEPPRGYSDQPGTQHEERTGLRETLRELSQKTTFWMNITAATVLAFVGYGVGNFSAPFFQRTHGLNVAEVATQIAVPLGLAASVGALAAGYLTERASGRYPNAVAVIPGVSLILCVPFYWIGFSADSVNVALACLLVGNLLHYSYLGAQYTICQGVASPRSRATAIAIMLFVVNLIGYGLGPIFVGFLSDVLMSSQLESLQSGAMISAQACDGTAAELLATLGAAQTEICQTARAQGLGQSILYAVSLYGVGGVLYLITCKTLQKDLTSKMN